MGTSRKLLISKGKKILEENDYMENRSKKWDRDETTGSRTCAPLRKILPRPWIYLR
jgi:hypothetical protein